VKKKAVAVRAPTFPGDRPTGKRRKFVVTVQATVTITIDTSVFDQAKTPPTFFTPAPNDTEVVSHIAYNLVVNRLPFSAIDGYANCPDTSAWLVSPPDWDVNVEKEIR
jgi:hypothetical protein